MPRRPPLLSRLARSRLQTYIPGDIHERVDLYCARYRLKETQFFEAAAREKLDGIGEAKKLTEQLNLMSQQLELITEHCNLFVQMWMDHTRCECLPQAESAASRRQTKPYQDFVQQLATNLSNGQGFLRAYTKHHLASKRPRGAKPVSADRGKGGSPHTSGDGPVKTESPPEDLLAGTPITAEHPCRAPSAGGPS